LRDEEGENAKRTLQKRIQEKERISEKLTVWGLDKGVLQKKKKSVEKRDPPGGVRE